MCHVGVSCVKESGSLTSWPLVAGRLVIDVPNLT